MPSFGDGTFGGPSGTFADLLGAIFVASVDARTVSEAAALSTLAGGLDVGAASETALARVFAPALDLAASAESSALASGPVSSDIRSAADAGALLSAILGADVAAGFDLSTLVGRPAGADVGLSAESALVQQLIQILGSDSGTGADTSAPPNARIDSADARAAVDAGALVSAIVGADLAAAIDSAVAVVGLLSIEGLDVLAAAVDSGTLSPKMASTDLGAVAELAGRIAAIAATDVAGPGADNAQMATFVFGTQATGGTTEVGVIAVTVSVMGQDAGGATEIVLVTTAYIPANDAALGNDLGLITGKLDVISGIDGAFGSDLASMVAPGIVGLDVRTAVDLATVLVPKLGADTSSTIEASIMAASALYGIDVEQAADLSVLVAAIKGQDTATDFEAIRLLLSGIDLSSSVDAGALRASYELVDNPSALDLATILLALAVSDIGTGSDDARAGLRALLPAIVTGRIARGSRTGNLIGGSSGQFDRGSSGLVRGR